MRLQPLAGSKEMIRIADRPVIDHLVERLDVAYCDRIIVITRADKADVIGYAEGRGLTVVIGEPANLAQSIALGLIRLAADDVALVGLPDTVWTPRDGFVELRRSIGSGREAVLGLFRSDEPERSDVVEVDPAGLVTAIVSRPRDPSSSWIWGCVAARPAALDGMESAADPALILSRLAQARRLAAVRLGHIVDIGTPEGLARAMRGSAVSPGGAPRG
jgi:NDP-sugar pyrophosphorylase family protein